MALVCNIICDTCHEEKEVWHGASESPPVTCAKCIKLKAEADKQAHLDGLARLPLEERLRRIEGIIYDQSLKRAYEFVLF